jgi:hypothetical protein
MGRIIHQKKYAQLPMESLISLLKIIPILIAAMILGNWFLSEVKKNRKSETPWYAPYLSTPGILIFIIILIPVLIWILSD